jgi:sugar/nucleoside kinase (ribokinase family)
MKDAVKNMMKNTEYDVSGIGSALLDFTVEVDDSFLNKLKLDKGGMQLIDEERSREILSIISSLPMETSPGGSAANTLDGISRFGGASLLMGKVGDDDHGDIYIKETEKSGVATNIVRDSHLTGHAITFITPDSERSFATHLGAAQHFTKDDINEQSIVSSKILHLEGYLFEPPVLREACFHALKIAKDNGVLISVDLSDPHLIGRIRETFDEILNDFVNIVFVNEDEAKAITGQEEEKALNILHKLTDFTVVKLGAQGSLIQYESEVYNIPVVQTSVVNTNGAGDMYAAGILYGLSRGYSPDRCGVLASYASSLVVAQVGARLNGHIDTEEVMAKK